MLIITDENEILEGKAALTGMRIKAVILLSGDGSQADIDYLQSDVIPHLVDTNNEQLCQRLSYLISFVIILYVFYKQEK